MCVLCVQLIAIYQSEIENPNMKLWESYIQDYKQQINHCDTEIKQIIENKGESII